MICRLNCKRPDRTDVDMSASIDAVSDEVLQKYHDRLKKETESSGYHLNPDKDMTGDLIRGLIVNQRRNGYPSCPCRLASGEIEEDLDIICPCDYRDPDLDEYDMCYCALYVSGVVLSGKKVISTIPERRPAPEERAQARAGTAGAPLPAGLSKPVWRCRVCGYLCGRDEPPEKCPICGAQKERFERFM